jgi:hypothetical protein
MLFSALQRTASPVVRSERPSHFHARSLDTTAESHRYFKNTLNILSVIPGLNITSRERFVTATLLALAVLSYAFWLTRGFHSFWRPGEGVELTFNSMLEHLLRGEFDVDPSIVGIEGFYRDGRVFAYWGIFFAVIRSPLMLLPGGLGIDVTGLSCFVAVCIAACAKLAALHVAFQSSPASVARGILYWTLGISILFAGPQIEFLQPSLWQEVCLWSGALAAIFVYFATRGIIRGRFSRLSLCAMAFVAGLALLARVSTGVGLYAALGLLVLAMLVREPSQGSGPQRAATGATPILVRLLSSQFLLPILLLLGFAVLTGLVNYQRWGHPLVFADYRLHIMNEYFPDRMPRTEAYGLFNLSRVPFGIVYYYFPIWVLFRHDGHLLFEEHQRRLMDATELPPSSFFLTDPILMLLLLYAGWSLLSARRSAGINRLHALAIGTGLTVPCLLMLSAISMNFRYRIEFYPLMEFGAFLGFVLLCSHPLAASSLRRVRTLAIASAALGILGSHAIMMLYKLSDLGPSIKLLRVGVFAYYLQKIQSHWPWLGSWMQQ